MALLKIVDIDLTYNQQVTAALVGVVGATYLLYRLLRSPDEFPPGPSTLPILGNLHQMLMCDGNIIKFLEANRKKYGNVYTIQLGGVKRVVVSGYEAFCELLEKNAEHTSNRSTLAMPKTYAEIAKTTPGLFWAEFPHWKTIRSFALTQLRDEGMGKSHLEPKIMEEFNFYVEHFLTPYLGQAVGLHESLNLATANVISSMLFGERQQYTDENFLAWKNALDESFKDDPKAAIFRNIPLAKYLPNDITGMKTNKKNSTFASELRTAWVKQQKEKLDPDNPAGFLDNLLVHSQKLHEKGENLQCFTDSNAAVVTMQMYAAGMETTSTALRWALLYMSVYPEIQKKVQEEIDQVIGQREVVYKDRLDMPYMEAVTQEVLRRSNIVPSNLPHTLEKTVIIHGKTIPAGSELTFNMASILHDESVFEEPDQFKPERFLTGDVELKRSRNLAFGIGRRVCLGKDLAKMEFFLFFVSFMQRFSVTYLGEKTTVLEGVPGIVNSPSQEKLIFTARV